MTRFSGAALRLTLFVLLAAAAARTSRPAAAQGASLSGRLCVTARCGPDAGSTGYSFHLDDDRGGSVRLELSDRLLASVGGTRRAHGRRVAVTGSLGNAAAGLPGTSALRVSELRPLDSPDGPGMDPAAVSGSLPYAVILCRFADLSAYTPQQRPYFEVVSGGEYPGVSHYWSHQSYGAVDVAGSRVFGWYTLPKPRSGYGSGTEWDEQSILRDAVAVADADVRFPDFAGIAVILNDPVFTGYGTLGVGPSVKADGQTRPYRVSWITTDQESRFYPGKMAHEIGHNLGFDHSCGPAVPPPYSPWDIMGYPYSSFDFTYGFLPQGTISHWRNQAGWVPPLNRFPAPSGSHTIRLERLDDPSTPDDYWMAQIPISGSRFYTVEARMWSGYDFALPGEAVIIHRVDTSQDDYDARLVDADNDGDLQDDGVQWLPGETFTDAANKISVTVVSQDATGFSVTITRGTSGGGGAGKLKLTPAKPKLVRQGDGSYLGSVTLTSIGKGTLTGTVSTLAAPFAVTAGSGDFSLSRKQTLQVTVRLSPPGPGIYKATLSLESNDPKAPKSVSFSVRVKG
jgi:hypothetical protein